MTDLIDLIYEAAVIPGQWPEVLQRIADLAGARGTVLLTARSTNVRWLASPDVQDVADDYLGGSWHAKNSRLPTLEASRHAGFLREVDMFTAEQIEANDHIVNFFRPRGLGWGAGMIVPVPSGDTLVFSIERNFDRGPVESSVIPQLDALRGALSRAALLSARLGFDKAVAMTSALQAVGLPAAILRSNNTVLAANRSFEALIPDQLKDGRERLQIADRRADGLLQSAFASLLSPGARKTPLSIPIAASRAEDSAVLHLMPLRRDARDVFNQAHLMVIVTTVDRQQVPPAELISALFDLTPAEARVARAIAASRSPAQIAADSAVSVETVRTQIKAVLQKTGLNRQIELSSLLQGLALPVNPDRE